MIKRNRLGIKLMVVVLVTIGMLGIGMKATRASANSWHHPYTTPTALRGSWYQYEGNGHYLKVRITPHSYKMGTFYLSPYQSGYHKLYVTRYNGRYMFNRANYHYQMTPQFWIGKRWINGRYHRVMKAYFNMGYYQVFLHKPVHHDYSYQK